MCKALHRYSRKPADNGQSFLGNTAKILKSLAEFAARRRQIELNHFASGRVPETKFVKGVFCSSVIVATRYSSCVCGLHRELRTCGDFYAARLYSTTPARAAPAMTLMGLGFHLRRTKKPARKITRAIRSKLPKSAGRVRWP